MYVFKLSSGKTIKYAMIEGHSIAGLALEGINVFIKVMKSKQIKAFFTKKDTKSLEGMEIAAYLSAAKKMAEDFIKEKTLDLFLSDNKDYIVDIFNSDNISYYSRTLPLMKNKIYLKMQSICGEVILEKLEQRKVKILIY